MGKSYLKENHTLWLHAAMAAMLFLYLLAPQPASADWYWIGDQVQSGSGDWDASPNLWNTAKNGSGTTGLPGSGDTANVWQGSNSAGLLTVGYSGANYSSAPLGTIIVKNTAATGSFMGSPSDDTGVGWVMLDQTGGAMNTNYVKIGALGLYKIENNATLTVQSSSTTTNGTTVWTTGTLGAAGFITNMDSGRAL